MACFTGAHGMARRITSTAPADTQVHACYGSALLEHPLAALPELEVIAHTEIQKPQPGLAVPFREGTLNLYLGYKGSKTISVAGRQFTLTGGDLFVTPPGIQHESPALPMSKCAHYWLRIRLDLPRPFLGDPGLDALRDGLRAAGTFHGRHAQQDLIAVRTIYDQCRAPATPLRDLQVRMQIALLLVQVLGRMSAPAAVEPQPAVALVTDYLARHLGEDLSVNDMADVAGISVTALQTVFRSQIGMPPGEYFTRLKMDEARRLLRTTELPVRQISQALGYRSERYFSAAFRRYFLLPPGRFRQQRGAAEPTP
jgi:AraC-like DNA-binding protein